MDLVRVGKRALINLRHLRAVRIDAREATAYFPDREEVGFPNEDGEWDRFIASFPESPPSRLPPKNSQGGPDAPGIDLASSE